MTDKYLMGEWKTGKLENNLRYNVNCSNTTIITTNAKVIIIL